MNEMASARPERIVTVVSDIINRREEIFRLIWIVVVAGFALGFIVNLISTLLWEYTNWIWNSFATLLSVVILTGCIYWALKSYAGDIHQTVHFELLFPFRANHEMEALTGKYYKILPEFKRRTDALLKIDDEKILKIREDWQKFVAENQKSILEEHVPYLLLFLHDLAEFFIMDYLQDFTNKNMTGRANYQQFGWMRPSYQHQKFSLKEGLAPLSNANMFLKLLEPGDLPKKLLFLKGFSFNWQAQTAQTKAGKGFFEFISKYGKFKFLISPFPILMRRGWRDSSLISHYCHLLEEDTITIKVPFALEIDFRGIKIMRKEFREIYAPFLEDLVDYFQHNMDWQYCAQYDLERMVVEMAGREV